MSVWEIRVLIECCKRNSEFVCFEGGFWPACGVGIERGGSDAGFGVNAIIWDLLCMSSGTRSGRMGGRDCPFFSKRVKLSMKGLGVCIFSYESASGCGGTEVGSASTDAISYIGGVEHWEN